MTYLYRLAKRIAGLRPFITLSLFAGLSCSRGERVDFLSPNPNPSASPLSSLRVEPLIASVRSGAQIQFSATGYSAGGQRLAATIDWTSTGGAVAPDGKFTGVAVGSFWVIARVRNQAAIADSARIGVWDNDNELIGLVVYPDSAVVEAGDSLQAVAALLLANGDQTEQATVTWTASGGTIDANGWFSAPEAGTYILTAASAVGLRADARVLVQPKVRRLERITLDRHAVTLGRGESISFSATGAWSDGSIGIADVVWSATGGSVSGTGDYVAGGIAGVFQVIARDASGSVADTAFVTVTVPTVVRLAMSPKSLTLAPGATQQFGALAQLSDGSWQAVPLVWSASGGSLSANGLYVAPSAPGSYQVVVQSPVTADVDSAYVVVVQPGATLTQFRINPSSVTVGAGDQRQFSAVADWSDGSNTLPIVAWSATGGSITASGLFVAGTTPGSYHVIGAVAGGLADTSTVTVAPPVLTGLSATPVSTTLLPGQTQQFLVAGSWSDGGTTAPQVAWTVSGGIVTGAGLYTSGSVAGTYAIIATELGGNLADTCFVTITPAPVALTSLLLTPGTGVLAPGAGMDFKVLGTWSDGSKGVPPVTYSGTGGTLSSGRYVAGSMPGTYRVIATHTGGKKADTSTVIITTPVTLTSLLVAPKPVSLIPGAVEQFRVTATWSNGSTALPLVTWSATGGTILSTGFYAAGSTPGAYRVIAAHQGGTRRDTVNVTVLGTPPPPPPPPPASTLTTLVIAPKPVSVAIAGTRQFTLSATWSDGSTTVPAVSWSATGGTVSSTGLYAAGNAAGSYRVIATQQAGAKADTAAVTITASAVPVVTSITLTPVTASVLAGTSQGFTALGHFSDGSTGAVLVNWSATGGTVSGSGSFTAGASAGAYQVTATMLGGLVNANAPVTVTVPSPSACVGGPNQPAGYFVIVGRKFNSLGTGTNGRGSGSFPCKSGGSEGWDDAEYRYSNVTVTNDATAPLSGSSILRMLYPPQTVPSGQTYSPGVVQTMGFTGSTYGQRRYRKVYLRTALRVSANWQGHQTSTNKLFFVRANDAPLPTGGTTRMEPIIRLRGVGAGALVLNVDLQGSPRDPRTNTGGLNPNTPGASAAGAFNIQRGQWHILEVALEIGQNGAANGKLKIWVNGVLTHDYNDIEFEPSAVATNYWDVLHIAPTWGGQAGTINQLMWLDYDEFFISGAP